LQGSDGSSDEDGCSDTAKSARDAPHGRYLGSEMDDRRQHRQIAARRLGYTQWMRIGGVRILEKYGPLWFAEKSAESDRNDPSKAETSHTARNSSAFHTTFALRSTGD
jgi:hypothetical protein